LYPELEILESFLHSNCIVENSMLVPEPLTSTEITMYRSESYQLRGDETLSFVALPVLRVPMIGSTPVEVRLGAVGINFREVLHLLGMVSTPDGTIGGDAAGTVVMVRDKVCGFVEGTPVCGWIGNDFCKYSTPRLGSMVRFPAHLSCEESATMYTVWLTVGHAFGYLCGDLRCKDSLLTHAATGGVGISSLWLAHSQGTVVVATAGSVRKRAWLRDQGVNFLSTTRDPEQLNRDLRGWFGTPSLMLVLNALSNRFIQIGFDQLQTVNCLLSVMAGHLKHTPTN
jgi:polyketide synthase 12